jgi:uncharacterized protein YdaU (DUF1376 family)
MGRSPAFQCYAKDLYTGTSDLTAAEFGAYWRGICWSWDNGPLPLKPEPRRRALLLDRRDFDRIWPNIRGLWKRTSKGFVNARLEKIRAEQDEYFAKQAQNGRKGGRPPKTQNNPPVSFGLSQTEPKQNLSDLRSSSALEDQEQDQEPARGAVTFSRPVEISERPNVRVISAVVRKSGLLGEGPDADEDRKVAVARARVGPYSGEVLERATNMARATAARRES